VPPAGAEAVLFMDRSELLACLASDWQEGSALTRWWWQSLFEGADVALAVLHEWLAAPEYIPAAVARLAVKRKAAAFANALRPADARALLQAVTHRFALNELASALAAIADDRQMSYEAGATGPCDLPDVPWQPWAPECAAVAPSPERGSFLGITLTLQRPPAFLSTSAFAHAVRRWRGAVGADETDRLKIIAATPEPEERRPDNVEPEAMPTERGQTSLSEDCINDVVSPLRHTAKPLTQSKTPRFA